MLPAEGAGGPGGAGAPERSARGIARAHAPGVRPLASRERRPARPGRQPARA